MNTTPSIAEAEAINGREFAMLNESELRVLDFFRNQGRKYGVSIEIKSDADPAELQRAASPKQADEILKRARSTVRVTVTK